MMDSMVELAPLAQAMPIDSGIEQTMLAGDAMVSELSIGQWLGPLAPLALSPFFGLAMLSGVATYGPDWLQEQNPLLGNSSALQDPTFFWIMLALSVVTSLPRFAKVSKPIALVCDNLEAYSAVIIFVAIRLVGTGGSDEPPAGESMVLAAGVVDVSLSVLLALFACLNFAVINVVKLFFEFLVWLMPFPSVDALLEIANKSICCGLMLIYMFSPVTATALNLILFLICLLVFGWCYRRMVFYRDLIGGPILAWFLPGLFRQRGDSVFVYSEEKLLGLPAYTRMRLTRVESESSGIALRLRGRWLWNSIDRELRVHDLSVERTMIAQVVTLSMQDDENLRLVHRKWVRADEWSQLHWYQRAPESGQSIQPSAG